ncbi:uncharacterized protein ASPGLDRAFT_42293 [Aspergillus glaucus CBS 516.65]|uniref:Kazal-like domain-containing protein n=1 Tax=Aspergillus glaucus CBS 516.65 TaxID=1160497 RepID=A0A1L9VXS2_ASPGL|nr:hypothetical protein ASPGLDRAFT_42293 [Aspergillus glaucus CBS 516.65]OJJ88714.1 hypothetical protein ASPGLDRAFT_42293 [Aspergillus glaucus CBS 516.65]
MKLTFGTTLLLLHHLALALPTPEVPEEPAVSIPEEPTVPVQEAATIIPPCQQVCPPEWAPVCAKDEYDNIMIFSSFCRYYNANCGKQRYILGRIEECIEPGNGE